MSTFRRFILAALVFTGTVVAADPPKEDTKVPPLAELIKVLKDGTRAEQVEAAETIRDHYEGKCLEAIPQMAASMGRELARRYGDPEPGMPVNRRILEAAQRAGADRFKLLYKMTFDKDPLIRAGAFRLLLTGSATFQKDYYDSVEQSELDLSELLKLVTKGAADESPLVRIHALITLSALRSSGDELTVPAAKLLAKSLEDREQVKDQAPTETPALWAAATLQHYQAKAKPAFEPLLKAAESDDEFLGGASARALGRLAESDEKMATAAVKLFRKQLSDPKASDRVLRNATNGLGELGKYAEPAVLDVVALLTRPKCSDELRSAVVGTLCELGPNSAPAVPTLLALLDRATGSREQRLPLFVLGKIGPPARDAVKAIEKWADKNPDMPESVRKVMNEALDKIK